MLTYYIFSIFSKVGRITHAKGAMVFHIRIRVLWYLFHSTGTGTIATGLGGARKFTTGKWVTNIKNFGR